jgi:hypothetical protein
VKKALSSTEVREVLLISTRIYTASTLSHRTNSNTGALRVVGLYYFLFYLLTSFANVHRYNQFQFSVDNFLVETTLNRDFNLQVNFILDTRNGL